MELVAHSLAQSDSGDRQAGRMHAGCASEHAVMSGFLRIHAHQVPAEKPEMLSVSEVKDVPYDECDPAEEFFSVCIALVQRRKHRPVKKNKLCTTVSSADHVQVTTVFRKFPRSSRFHLHVTSSSSTRVCFCTCLCDVWPVYSWFWFSTFIYISWQSCILPICPEKKMRNHGQLIKLRLDVFIFRNFQPRFSAALMNLVNLMIIHLCDISKTSRKPEFTILPQPLQLFKLIKQIIVVSC